MRSVRQACSPAPPGFAESTLLCAVRVAHRHADHHDRVDNGGWWGDPGNAPSRPDDDRPADFLPQDPVGAPDVASLLRGDRGGLQSQPRLSHGSRGVADHGVARGTAVRQREVEPHQLEVQAEYLHVEDPQCLVEQLLTRFVAVTHDDLPPRGHWFRVARKG